MNRHRGFPMTLRNSVLAVAIAALCLPLSAPVLAAQSKKEDAPAEVPKPDPTVQVAADLQPKMQGLSKEKLEFVTGGKAARFMPTKALLERFRTSTPQEIEAMIDAMISVGEQSKYHDGVDPGSIPLNTASESFNKIGRASCRERVKRPGGR